MTISSKIMSQEFTEKFLTGLLVHHKFLSIRLILRIRTICVSCCIF